MTMPDLPDIPEIPEMQKAISRLRMLLAEVKRKEDELENAARQFRRQLQRAPRHAIHGGNSLDATLNIMGEIQERMDQVEVMQRHLETIKSHAQSELHALNLTGKIEEAKTELRSLRRSRAAGQEADEERISELERFIEEASIRAAEAITGGNFNVPEL